MKNANSRSSVSELCNEYVDSMVRLDPASATGCGVAGYDHLLPDYSPDGCEQRTDLARATLSELATIVPRTDPERVAADLLHERLTVEIEDDEAGERLRDVRVLGSTLSTIRGACDVMAKDTEAQWQNVASRLEAVAGSVAGLRASLDLGIERQIVAARRQAIECARQAEVWAGEHDAPPYATTLTAPYRDRPDAQPALARRLDNAAAAATRAFGEIGAYLRGTYVPAATEHDPVGPQRYARAVRISLGTAIDPREAYDWAWDELHRIETEARRVINDLLPGASVAEAIDYLDHDPQRSITGVEEFRAWNQQLIDTTMDALDGTHFHIPSPIRRCEAMIAPPGGAAAMYYTAPSEDLTRPGRTWYPTLGKTVFPLWREVSICYHEGVPGHHLQVAQLRLPSERLNRYQTLVAWVAGHGEGWALYAERLMAELGFYDDPAYELGQLCAQAMRAVRVIVDIGMHLEYEIPAGEANAGARWNPELALRFAVERSLMPEAFMRSEIDRYLGLPAQAISYKLGERVWLNARDAARERHGRAFDLKQFHTFALELGPVGLGQLERELDAF